MTKYICRECSNPCILESNNTDEPTICPFEYTSVSDDPIVNWKILKLKNNDKVILE